MLSPQLKPARRTHTTFGYSLTELAIVLAIIGLVAGSTLSVGKLQLDVAETSGTSERLEVTRRALLLFHKKYERYPCPALPADTSASATYGREVAGGCDAACPAGLTCNNSAVIGAVPFKDLKINEETAYDSWDAKITYAVDKNHTQTSVYNTGGILIKDINGNEVTTSPTLGDAIFVLASHGRDGKGAYTKSGTLMAPCGAVGKDVENCNGDDTFTDSRYVISDNPASYYDDLIAWQTQENVNTEEEEEDIGFPLAVADTYTCMENAGKIRCWGENTYYMLGDGTTTNRSSPVEATVVTDFVQGLTGVWHACIKKSDGTAWCWGRNQFGQIGDGTTTDRPSPVQVSGLTNVKTINPGEDHTCALKNDDTIWCWGNNIYGQLGDGTTTQRLTPVQVLGITNVAQLVSGDFFTCVLKQDATEWCWGRNTSGQLGDGTTTDRSLPVQVSGLTNISRISLQQGENCAVKSDGTAWCWGRNNWGQIGDGTTTDRLTPVAVSGLTNVARIAPGTGHSCAAKTDGSVWCWGHNIYGALGDGTTIQRLTPVLASGLTGVIDIGAGDDLTCARKSDSTVWCWGRNIHGEVGDGTTTDRHVPTQVLNLP